MQTVTRRLIFLANLLFLPISAQALEPVTPDSKAKQAVTSEASQVPDQDKFIVIKEGVASDFLASRYARNNGDIDAAITYIGRLRAQYPNDSEVASQLMLMRVIKGDMPLAIELAQTIKQSGGGDALAGLLLVLDAAKQQKYEQARQLSNESFVDAEGQLWLPLIDAWIDIGLGQLKNPVLIDELPVAVGGAASLMNYHLALINRGAGFPEEATQNFYDALNGLENRPQRWQQIMKHFYELRGKPQKLEKLVLEFQNNAPEAAAERPEAVVVTPSDGIAEVLFTMGSVMQMAGANHDAAVYLQMARYLRPDFHLATLNLAEVLKSAEFDEPASQVLSSIPSHSQFYMQAQLRRAVNLDDAGQKPEAMKVLEKLIESQPGASQPWIIKADLLRSDQQFEAAVEAYTEAILHDTNVGKQDWPVYYSRAACLERLGRWDEAKADFVRALELAPNQPDVLNYYAYSMLVRGEKLEIARDMLLQALARRPNDPHIVDSLGWAYFLLSDYRTALTYMERAVELMPADATVNDHLGDVYFRLGRKYEAVFQWERALTYKPEEKEAMQIEEKIKNGLPDIANVPRSSAAMIAPPVVN